jgi:transcription antitermination factor NusG
MALSLAVAARPVVVVALSSGISDARVPQQSWGFEFPEDEDEDDDEDEDEEEAAAAEEEKDKGKEVAEAKKKSKKAKENLSELSKADDEVLSKPADEMTMVEMKALAKRFGRKSGGTKKELTELVQNLQRRHALGMPLRDTQVASSGADHHWYMLQTANGFERAVERNINMAVDRAGLREDIEQVFVPILEGETSVRESSVMPQYIFLRMRMDEKLHFFISKMNYVINFVGADHGQRNSVGMLVGGRGFVRPMPITDEAFGKIVALTRVKINQQAEAEAAEQIDTDDIVEVLDGPFKGMEGRVLEKSSPDGEVEEEEEESLTVLLPIMGRDTPVTVPLRYCEKIGSAQDDVEDVEVPLD